MKITITARDFELTEPLKTRLEKKVLNGTRKNMRAKISYTIGLLRKKGLISINRGERGKLKIKLTSIGRELLKILI